VNALSTARGKLLVAMKQELRIFLGELVELHQDRVGGAVADSRLGVGVIMAQLVAGQTPASRTSSAAIAMAPWPASRGC